MQNAFAYCADLVRAADRDRYLAALFAPAEHRSALHAVFAFTCELARVREVARQSLPGEIRLQWWREVLSGEREGEANANPVASALLATIKRYGIAVQRLLALIEARRFDLYDEPMRDVAALEDYERNTSSATFAFAAQILAGVEAQPVAEPAGIAHGICATLHEFPRHTARHQLYLPIQVLDRHDVRISDLSAGRSTPALNAAMAELRSIARVHLAAAREHMSALPAAALPAFLPIAVVGRSLDCLERSDAFSPHGVPSWRRQWLIWRAAHDPARIAA
jgi:15-cis-phytoene synthase